jgi:hypothetical protein
VWGYCASVGDVAATRYNRLQLWSADASRRFIIEPRNLHEQTTLLHVWRHITCNNRGAEHDAEEQAALDYERRSQGLSTELTASFARTLFRVATELQLCYSGSLSQAHYLLCVCKGPRR